MSKMREVFEKWAWEEGFDLDPDPSGYGYDDTKTDIAFAGFHAAIAAVKEGGVCGFIGQHTSGTPLYKLPEDDTP